MKKCFMLLFITATLLLSGCSEKPNIPNIPNIDNIKVVNLNLNSGPGANQLIPPLHLNDSRDKETIMKVLGWLNASQLVGEDKAHVIPKGGGPTVLEMELENGDYVYIEPALDSITSKLANGSTLIEMHPINDQIVFKNKEAAVRLNSPELYAWISGGWKEDLNK